MEFCLDFADPDRESTEASPATPPRADVHQEDGITESTLTVSQPASVTNAERPTVRHSLPSDQNDDADLSDSSLSSLSSTDIEHHHSHSDDDWHIPGRRRIPCCLQYGDKSLPGRTLAEPIVSDNDSRDQQVPSVYQPPRHMPYPPQSKGILRAPFTPGSGQSIKFDKRLTQEKTFFRDEIIDKSLHAKRHAQGSSSPSDSEDADDEMYEVRRRSKRIKRQKARSSLYRREAWGDVHHDRERRRLAKVRRNSDQVVLNGNASSRGHVDPEYGALMDIDDTSDAPEDDDLEYEQEVEASESIDVLDATPADIGLPDTAASLSDAGSDTTWYDEADTDNWFFEDPLGELNSDIIRDADSRLGNTSLASRITNLVDLAVGAEHVLRNNDRPDEEAY